MFQRSHRFAALLLGVAVLSGLASAQSQGIVPIVPTAQPNIQMGNLSPQGLNNSGQVAGGAFGSWIDPTNPRNVLRWSQAFLFDGTFHWLPMIGLQCNATGINDSGVIIGTFVGTDNQFHVARFTTSTITDLGLVGSVGQINNNGHFLFTAANITPPPTSPFAPTPGATYIVDINTLHPVRQLSFRANLINDNDDVAGPSSNFTTAYVDFGAGAINVASLLPVPPSDYVYDSIGVQALGPNHQFAGVADAAEPFKGGGFYRFNYLNDPVGGVTVFPVYPTQINTFNSLGDYAGSSYWHNGQETTIQDLVGPGPWSVGGVSFLNDHTQMVMTGSNFQTSLPNVVVLFDPSLQVNYDPVITIQGTGQFDFDNRPHAATASATGYLGTPLSDPTISYSPGGSNAPVQPGTYQVIANYPGSPHYNSATVTGTIVIQSTQSPTSVNVTGGTFTYDGTAHTATASVVDGSNAPVPSATAAISYSPGGSNPPVYPGTYQVTATYGGDATHLSSTGTATIVIGNANLVINVDSKTMLLNGAVPTLTGTVTGSVSSDALAITYATTATSANPIGSYPINASISDPLGHLGYYNVTINPGLLKVMFAGNTGALQPINQDGSSVFKQGSTVTVKFQAFDANGRSVGAPSAVVQSFYLIGIENGTVTQTVNEPVSTNNPDTNFRWDSSAQQWIFNISTKGMTSGDTYFFEITLTDGTTIDFHFGLR